MEGRWQEVNCLSYVRLCCMWKWECMDLEVTESPLVSLAHSSACSDYMIGVCITIRCCKGLKCHLMGTERAFHHYCNGGNALGYWILKFHARVHKEPFHWGCYRCAPQLSTTAIVANIWRLEVSAFSSVLLSQYNAQMELGGRANYREADSEGSQRIHTRAETEKRRNPVFWRCAALPNVH